MTDTRTILNTDIQQLLRNAGLDPAEVDAHLSEHGRLADSHYAALAAVGLSGAVVNQFLQSNVSTDDDGGDAAYQMAVAKVGGEAELKALLNWAREKLSDPDLEDYNAKVNDPATAGEAVDALIARHSQAVAAGQATTLAQDVTQDSGGPGAPAGQPAGAAPFASIDEMRSALQDPRYSPGSSEHDPQYYQETRARLAATELIGPASNATPTVPTRSVPQATGTPTGSPQSAAVPFTSHRDVRRMMADPRYSPASMNHDPDYYNNVRAKLAVTDLQKIQ